MNPTAPETDSTLLSLQAAICAAADRDDAAGVAAACLEHAQAASEMVPKGKAPGEQVKQAEVSGGSPIRRASRRDRTLFIIAISQKDSGLLTEAHETTLLLKDKDVLKVSLLSEIAQSYKKIGQLTESYTLFMEAFQSALHIQETYYKYQQLAIIAAHAHVNISFIEAANIAALPTEGMGVSGFCETILTPFAEVGNVEAVLIGIKRFERLGAVEWVRDEVLNKLITALIKSNRLDDARRVAGQVSYQGCYCGALAEIAVAEAKSGLAEKSRNTFIKAQDSALLVEESDYRDSSIIYIAKLQASVGEKVEANKIISLLKDANQRDALFDSICWSYARADCMTDAEVAAKQIKNAAIRAAAFLYIARCQTKVNQLIGIENILSSALAAVKATKKTSDSEQVKLLCDVAIAYSSAGRLEKSRQVCDKAIIIACSSDKIPHRNSMLERIVKAQAQIGWTQASLQTADLIDEALSRSFALRWALEACTRIGTEKPSCYLVEAAIDSAMQVQLESSRGSELSSIASLLVEGGDFVGATALCDCISDDRDANLSHIAYAMANYEQKNVGFEESIMSRRSGFKKILVPCSYYPDSAYGVCSGLARIYPKQAGAISEIVATSTL